MTALGLLVTFLGFLLSVFSLSLTSSVNGRLFIVLVGLAMCLIGIIGIINKGLLRNAIWRK
ncbi:MAG: hypothetical protein JST11_19365 [Acidobacteria bacterium]|nr:hypothetical protein [Acidobacteriota bacterium]